MRNCLLGSVLSLVGIGQAGAQSISDRTVIDSQIGAIFTYPNGYTLKDLGAYVSTKDNLEFRSMGPQALKIIHARFHVFRPSDDYTWSWFPYSALRSYEAQELAAGRPPIFVTATYQGKQRPVVWSWSLGLQGALSGQPTTPPSNWEYAVNVADDRFIKFWLNRFVRDVLYKNQSGVQNLWVGADECAFIPNYLYGVLDDNNNFVPGVKWDPPFAQNDTEYYNSITYFFTRAKQLAPDINVMPNSGGISDWSKFPIAHGAADGVMVEEINPVGTMTDPNTAIYVRNDLFNQWTAYSWASSQNKVMIFRSDVPSYDPVRIRSSYMIYLLLKGANSFYAPTVLGTTTALQPSTYSSFGAQLGNPTGSLQSVLQPGTPSYWPGFRLYSRQYEGGIVYVNFSAVSQTITLPTGQQYYNSSGVPVTQITVPDMTGDYVTFTSGPRAPMPRVDPRYRGSVSGPVTVTQSNPAGTGTIYYSANGYTPYYYSSVYTAPVTVGSNATVQARVDQPAAWMSFVNKVSYSIVPGPPLVQFVTSYETGPAGMYYPVVALSSIPTSAVTVSYYVQPSTGSPSQGVLTYQPGSQYAYLPISAASNTTVTIYSPIGATLGSIQTLQYVVVR